MKLYNYSINNTTENIKMIKKTKHSSLMPTYTYHFLLLSLFVSHPGSDFLSFCSSMFPQSSPRPSHLSHLIYEHFNAWQPDATWHKLWLCWDLVSERFYHKSDHRLHERNPSVVAKRGSRENCFLRVTRMACNTEYLLRETRVVVHQDLNVSL